MSGELGPADQQDLESNTQEYGLKQRAIKRSQILEEKGDDEEHGPKQRTVKRSRIAKVEDDDDNDNAELTDEDWVRRTDWYFDEPSGPFKHRQLLQALNLDPQVPVRSHRLWEAAIAGIGEHRMLSDAEYDVLPPAQERLYDYLHAKSEEHCAQLFDRLFCGVFAFSQPDFHQSVQTVMLGPWTFYDRYPEAMIPDLFFSPSLDKYRYDTNQPCEITVATNNNPDSGAGINKRTNVEYYYHRCEYQHGMNVPTALVMKVAFGTITFAEWVNYLTSDHQNNNTKPLAVHEKPHT